MEWLTELLKRRSLFFTTSILVSAGMVYLLAPMRSMTNLFLRAFAVVGMVLLPSISGTVFFDQVVYPFLAWLDRLTGSAGS